MAVTEPVFPSGEPESIDLVLLRSQLEMSGEERQDPATFLRRLPEAVQVAFTLVEELYGGSFLNALRDLDDYEAGQPHIFKLPGMPDDGDHYRVLFEMGRDYLVETGNNLANLTNHL